MLSPSLNQKPLNALAVEDIPKENTRIKRKLQSKGFFKVTARSDYSKNLKEIVKKSDLISLDIMVKKVPYHSEFLAKNIKKEFPEKTIIFFTAWPDMAREQKSPVNYYIEKKEYTWKHLDELYKRIFIHEKMNLILDKLLGYLSYNHLSSDKCSPSRIINESKTLLSAIEVTKTVPQKLKITPHNSYDELYKVINFCISEEKYNHTDLTNVSNKLFQIYSNEYLSLKSLDGINIKNTIATHLKKIKKDLDIIEKNKNNTPTLKRITQIDFPDKCKLNNPVKLKIQLKVAGKGFPMLIPFNNENSIKLTVQLSYKSFNAEVSQKFMLIPLNEDTETLEFTLNPLQTGVGYIFVSFFKATEKIGSAIISTIIEKE
jgi:hypothetical protein